MAAARMLDLSPGSLDAQHQTTMKNWSHFVTNLQSNQSSHQNNSSIRDFIRDSWLRCVQSGTNPMQKQTNVSLRDDEIRKIIDRSQLYESALPCLTRLSNQAKGTGHLITLCDSQGRILFLDGDHDVFHRAEQMNFVVGADWSEEAIGTNAIGTALVEKQPIQVFAAEHFCEGVHDWVCSAAPIRDPATNEVLGVVDATGLWSHAQSHTLSMMTVAADMIQSILMQQTTQSQHYLLEEYVTATRRYPGDGIILLDRAFQIIEANHVAIETVRTLTGKQLRDVWNHREFHNQLLHHRPRGNHECYEIVIENLDLSATVREIYSANRRSGFILIIKPLVQHSLQRYETVKGSWTNIVGQSPQIRCAIAKCDVAAQTNVPILLQGESGTGKEVFARAIHDASPRRNQPFVAINCGAIPRDLLASELFGYESGTFTGAAKNGKKGKFEEAQGGTIFLDEIGEMPIDFQVYLLRVLQEREIVRLGSAKSVPIDVRVIAATNRNLDKDVQNGKFRSDLYYRLNVVCIHLPPLRQRREDIPLLIQHVLRQLSDRHQLAYPNVDPDVHQFLVDEYDWPGNVRELQNMMEHALLFGHGRISWEALPPYVQPLDKVQTEVPLNVTTSGPHRRRKRNLKEANPARNTRRYCTQERDELLKWLEMTNGNISEVGRQLGIARTTVYRRMNKYGLLN
jgi:sigma-54 dependent transcriptional regulator, acetoin dehydrogenase operon transcriptional activator AcoR